MTLTLDALIYSTKTKRWFHVLGLLEEQQSITAQILADRTSCSERTIRSDIQEIKDYFGSSIALFGNEEGYHFSFQAPIGYFERKQALLDKEPLFLFLDQLLKGKRKTNQEWTRILALSPASFGRLKRVLVQLLKTQYSLNIVSIDNQIHGEEVAIRQLMYDFFFTLSLYPKGVEKKINALPDFSDSVVLENWALDPLRLKQWHQIFQWRIDQGASLPVKPEVAELQARLVAALNAVCPVALPAQEKATLFLLSLREDQFIDPLRQKAFVRQFFPLLWQRLSTSEGQRQTAAFLGALLYLMNQFFPLSTEEGTELSHLLFKYGTIKKQIERSLVLSFQLTGSAALQEWIKGRVRQQFQTMDIYLIEEAPQTPGIRQLTVTNRSTERETQRVLGLSRVPEEAEIIEKIRQFERVFLKEG